jgi:hypothetical protein
LILGVLQNSRTRTVAWFFIAFNTSSPQATVQMPFKSSF